MTEARPQSQVGPVLTAKRENEFLRVKVYDDRALAALKLKPVPTVWGRQSGRPVYDRLPAISQAYKLDYFGEGSDGYVYIEPQTGNVIGPGSLQIGAYSPDPSILIIQSGTITWAEGQVPVDGLAVNVAQLNEGIGLQDGVYQVGYYLSYQKEVSGEDLAYSISSGSLGSSTALYTASSALEEYPFDAAFTEANDGYWLPSENGISGSYYPGSYLLIDFRQDVLANEFKLYCPAGTIPTATCALYRSTDGIVWEKDVEVKPLGQVWELPVSSDDKWRYWKLFFWDGVVAVERVEYSGEAIFPNQRPQGSVSVATPFIEDGDTEITDAAVLLGFITVDNGRIVAVSDTRRLTGKKYEPVAKWLTDFQDVSLRELIDEVSDYAEKFLAPPTSLDPLYAELTDNYQFTLGSQLTAPSISLPTEIELRESTGAYSANVSPSGIILLSDPQSSSDLATKDYVSLQFTVSLDNGLY